MRLHSRVEIAKYYLKRLVRLNKPKRVPIYLFGHHKCGTKLFGKIFLKMAIEYGWSYSSVNRKDSRIPNSDIVFFLNSRINPAELPEEYIGIHIVRDPRDILVSGYLYHKRTTEPWCTNKNRQIKKKIDYPQVPNSQMHRELSWKIKYLESLGKKSYKEILNERDELSGLLFELNNYCAWTLSDMKHSVIDREKTVEIRFEDVMDDFEITMDKVFEHCNFEAEEKSFAIRESNKENIKNMDDKTLNANSHISSKRTSKWRDYLSDDLLVLFDKRHGELLRRYGYE